jgi:hypothetical protein
MASSKLEPSTLGVGALKVVIAQACTQAGDTAPEASSERRMLTGTTRTTDGPR